LLAQLPSFYFILLQLNASPGSVFLPGAISLWPTISVIKYCDFNAFILSV
jgi:hypothetical protein